jgi:hypothetical protein
LLEDFLVQNWEENIFKPTTGDKNLHENNRESNRVMIFATSQKIVVKSSVPTLKHLNLS